MLEHLVGFAEQLYPPLLGLAGVVLGGWLVSRSEKERRRHAFIADQLREFYSPLLGIRQELKARGEYRLEVNGAVDAAWRELCDHHRHGGPQALQLLMDTRKADFSRVIERQNHQLREVSQPLYRRMLEIFRERMWLAEPETRAHFGTLVRFVEGWDQYLQNEIPPEAVAKIATMNEETLLEFYRHIEERHDGLQRVLQSGGDRRLG